MCIFQQTGHIARAPLGGGVQRDAHQLVVDERVVEAVLHGGREGFQILPVQRQRGDDFLVKHAVHEAQDHIVLHAVAYNVVPGQIRPKHKACVRAVEDAHLAFFVGRHIGHHGAVQSCGPEWQLFRQPFGPFDIPHAEHLAHVDERVPVAVLLLQPSGLGGVANAAGYDAVHQRGAEGAVPVHPAGKAFLQPPLLYVLVHTAQQLLAVVVDELAGEHHHAGPARSPAVQQNLCQLCGKGSGRTVLKAARGVVHDARLGGVGDDVFQRFAGGYIHHGVVILFFIGVQAAAHRGDDALYIHLFAVLPSAQVQRVQALLPVDELRQPLGDGLHQNAFPVPARLFVGHVEPVVRKGAQKISLAELQHALGRVFQQIAGISGLFKCLIAQLFHFCFAPF